MRRVEAKTNTLTIEFCINGEKKADIYINPSFPGGCRKIHEALALDVSVADRTMKIMDDGDKEDAVVEYLQGRFEVAMKLMDGISEAIGPEQYSLISDFLPAIEIDDLIALSAAIIGSYSDYYSSLLKKGMKQDV